MQVKKVRTHNILRSKHSGSGINVHNNLVEPVVATERAKGISGQVKPTTATVNNRNEVNVAPQQFAHALHSGSFESIHNLKMVKNNAK